MDIQKENLIEAEKFALLEKEELWIEIRKLLEETEPVPTGSEIYGVNFKIDALFRNLNSKLENKSFSFQNLDNRIPFFREFSTNVEEGFKAQLEHMRQYNLFKQALARISTNDNIFLEERKRNDIKNQKRYLREQAQRLKNILNSRIKMVA
jgi:hypothetical protein